jgi:hypothetical protein
MKALALCTITLAVGLAACSKQEPAEPAAPADVPAQATAEETAAPQFDQDFIDHMHAHAEQLDELMFALADEDLEGAMTPAYWLSRHEVVTGVPEEWQQYISGMREAALAVEASTDLAGAQAAAHEITTQCQACHAAAGINVLGNRN